MKDVESKYIKIKINKNTGDIIKIKEPGGPDAIKVDPEEVHQVQQNPNTKNVAELLYTHSSPGCIYVVSGGWGYKICWG